MNTSSRPVMKKGSRPASRKLPIMLGIAVLATEGIAEEVNSHIEREKEHFVIRHP
jgi:hypothetical protein